MKDTNAIEQGKGTAVSSDTELENRRREQDELWEQEEARRREELIAHRVQSNWRNRWL